MKSVKKLW